LNESFISSLWNHALLIQDTQKSVWLVFNQVQHSLVVLELNISPLDLLLRVLLLLHLEDVAVEELLDLFVRIIDAELLKAVFLKILKAKNIQ
jgi:hypothetical protein